MVSMGSDHVEYDATAVRSRSLRGYIETTLDDLCLTRAENPWTSVASLRRQRPARRTVVVGDLCELVSSVDLDELAASPLSVSFLLLVRTERDRRRLAQPEVALRLNDDRFFVFDMKCLKPPDLHQAMHGYLEGLVERLAPDRLRSARFSQLDCVLWLEFGDGLARAADWSSLPFARRLSFTPVAASAREHGQSLLLVDADGREVDVDAGSLRAVVDPTHLKVIEEEDRGHRALVAAGLRQLREESGLSQEQLASRSGVPQESLSRIETGRREPRIGTLGKLADGFGLTLAELLHRLGAPSG